MTAAGLVALRAARAADAALAVADGELAGLREGRTGTVRFAAFASAAAGLAAPAIGRLARERPDVRVILDQAEPEDAYEALAAGELDLAITFADELAPRRRPASVAEAHLLDDPVLVALPATHRLARGDRAVDLRALADEDWIRSPGAGVSRAALRTLAREDAFATTTHFTGDDFLTVLALVAEGLGVALLPGLALARVPDGVVTRPLRGTPLVRRVLLARPKAGPASPAAAALEEALRAGVT